MGSFETTPSYIKKLMEQIDFSQIPYSQHHREAAMMLGSVQCQAVFGYLLDEYMYRLRQGKPTAFMLSCNKISAACNLQWHTVNKTIQHLSENMNLISVNDNTVTLDADKYLSLIYAFHNLSDKKSRTAFTKALSNNDSKKLEELGFVPYSHIEKELLLMNGSMLVKNNEDWSNLTNISQNQRTLVKFDQPSLNLTKVGQKAPTLSQGSSLFLTKVSQICRTHFVNFDDIEGSKDRFRSIFAENLDDNEIEGLILVIFDENGVFSEEQGLVIFDELCSKKLVKFDEGVSQNQRTEINKINNKKINQQAGEFSENFELSETEETFDELPDNLPKIKKGGKHFQKIEYPYFPASEVLEFIQDIHQCLDNDVKLFLYNFNQEIHARYDQDAEYDDETGEEIRPQATVDTSQLILSKSEVEDIASTAISNTRADIADKDIYVNDELVSITATDNLDRLTKFNIIDWQFELVGNGEKVCQVDWSRIQNPDETPLENLQSFSKRSRRTREGEVNVERELNKRYIASIIEHSAEDETWDKLSPMEKLIYNFLCDHFEFSESGLEVIDVKEDKKYLNRNMLFQYFSKELDSRPDTPSKEDFFSTFAKDKPDTYGGIKLRPNMFSATKIQRWNAKHGFQSVISSSDVQVTTGEEKIAQKA